MPHVGYYSGFWWLVGFVGTWAGVAGLLSLFTYGAQIIRKRK
jgi:hypothetical protein